MVDDGGLEAHPYRARRRAFVALCWPFQRSSPASDRRSSPWAFHLKPHRGPTLRFVAAVTHRCGAARRLICVFIRSHNERIRDVLLISRTSGVTVLFTVDRQRVDAPVLIIGIVRMSCRMPLSRAQSARGAHQTRATWRLPSSSSCRTYQEINARSSPSIQRLALGDCVDWSCQCLFGLGPACRTRTSRSRPACSGSTGAYLRRRPSVAPC